MKSTYKTRNGGERQKFFHTNDGAKATKRRKIALKNLQNQLLSGFKNIEPKNLKNLENPNDIGNGKILLTDFDKNRINSEINKLLSKIK